MPQVIPKVRLGRLMYIHGADGAGVARRLFAFDFAPETVQALKPLPTTLLVLFPSKEGLSILCFGHARPRWLLTLMIHLFFFFQVLQFKSNPSLQEKSKKEG